MLLTALKRVRELRALSQRELAARAGVHQVTIADLEMGHHRARASTTRKLARVLQVSPATLAGQDDVPRVRS